MRFVCFAWVIALHSVVGCSATIDPDLSRLDVDTGTSPGTDGGPLADAWSPPGNDTGVVADTGTDGGSPTDAWTAPDAWAAPDSGPVCTPGLECSGWSTALTTAPRDSQGLTPAAAIGNCVIQMHRSDCCGARDALGINHGARMQLCTAETSCDAMYPPATCSDTTITTDTGEMTTSPNNVRLRAVDPHPCPGSIGGTCYRCETFVCTSDPCRSAPGISGGCGG